MIARKAKGQQGSWFAEIDGETYPCVLGHWIQRGQFSDPGYEPGSSRWNEFVDKVRQGEMVIVRQGIPTDAPDTKSGKTFQSGSYVGLFKVKNVEADQESLRFAIDGKICDLK